MLVIRETEKRYQSVRACSPMVTMAALSPERPIRHIRPGTAVCNLHEPLPIRYRLADLGSGKIRTPWSPNAQVLGRRSIGCSDAPANHLEKCLHLRGRPQMANSLK